MLAGFKGKGCSAAAHHRSLRSALTLPAALATLLFLGGCSATPLMRPSLEPAVFELAARNPLPLRVAVYSAAPEMVGYQYLLVVFPLGRVEVPAPAEYLRGALYHALVEQGVRPLAEDAESGGASLTVVISSIRVSAFDFLFTRRVRARIELEAAIRNSSGTLLWHESRTGPSAELRRYGFKNELTAALDDAIAEVTTTIAAAVKSHSSEFPQ